MFRTNVNDEYDFLIEIVKDKLIVNGEKKDINLRKISTTIFHVIHHHRSYRVDILNYDLQNKTIKLKVNERDYKVVFQDDKDHLLETMGILHTPHNKVSNLVAPMPGLIVDIKVKEGQEVQIGDPLVVLKAMKMENVLKSTYQGVIRQIMVEVNQKIEKDALILQF